MYSVNGGPQYYTNGGYLNCIQVEYTEPDAEGIIESSLLRAGHRNATADYLENHVTISERYALEIAKYNPVYAMLNGSWREYLRQQSKLRGVVSTRTSHGAKRRYRGYCNIKHVWFNSVEEGLFSRYPLMNLIRNQLTVSNLRTLLEYECGITDIREEDIEHIAWGNETHPVILLGQLAFSDASSICKKTDCEYVETRHPYYV
jgi:hypothetical protein